MTKTCLLTPSAEDYRAAYSNQDGVDEYYRLEPTLDSKWTFDSVGGFFAQDDPNTDDTQFNYILDFGKLKTWKEILDELTRLNEASDKNTAYKLIFCARHGQGFHNVCQAKYGIQAWREKWHALTTDGEITWAIDPLLTEIGRQQARDNHDGWARELQLGAKVPAKFFVSPLQRTCQTFEITWDGLVPEDRVVKVDEMIRETIGLDLCDQRSTRSVIELRFPKLKLDDDVTEEDILFKADLRELLPERTIRVNNFLQALFEADRQYTDKIANQLVSLTCHAGTIRLILIATHHRPFTIPTGGMIPVLVKATKIVK